MSSFEATPAPSGSLPILNESRQQRVPPPSSYQPSQRQLRAAAEALVAHVSTSRSSMTSGGSGSPSVASTSRGVQTNQNDTQDLNVSVESAGRSNLLRESRIRIGGGGNRPSRTVPIIVSDDVVSGSKREGWMSPVRRFFCLLATFDLLFTALLWFVTVIVTGQDIKKALIQQILAYTIHDSLFDCVIIAAFRFLISLLFYGILDVNHWLPVALTTAGSSTFVGVKVFFYQWTRIGNVTFEVVLVLISFIMSWAELWFMDSKVLPLEAKARELMSHFEEDSETTPLIMNMNVGMGASSSMGGRQMLQRYMEGSVWDGSVANFYSPLESPEDSGDEIETRTQVSIPRQFKRKLPLNAKESELHGIGKDALQSVQNILSSHDWILERSVKSSGDKVFSKRLRKKKIFKFTGIVDLPPKFLLEELFFRAEGIPTWNPTISECRIIQPIDSHTDVSYQVCAEAANGAVSVRDFVNLRHWDMVGNDIFLSCIISITHPAMPAQPNRVRGHNGPSGFLLEPLGDDHEKCRLHWLLDTDLKGWIPQRVIDAAMCNAQLEYVSCLRKHANQLKDEGRVNEFLRRQGSSAIPANRGGKK